jgi:hypothetical protein
MSELKDCELEIARLRVGLLYLLDRLANPTGSYTMREILIRLNDFGLQELTNKWLEQQSNKVNHE